MAKIVFIIQREALSSLRSIQPKIFFPIEAAAAGAVLIKNGHQVRCLDLNLIPRLKDPKKELIKICRNFKPDFVVSAPQMLTFLITEDYRDTARLFRAIRAYPKKIKTIYCGAFATSYPRKAVEEVNPDYLIRGEFEIVLGDLIEKLVKKIDISCLKGVMASLDNNGAAEISTINDLDLMPLPAYDEFDHKKYFKYPGRGNLRFPEHSLQYTIYQTSRGCTAGCCFCNVSFLRGGRRYRVRSLPKVLDDLTVLVKEKGIKEIHFLDENLTLNKRRVIELCKGIKERGLSFNWIASGGMSVYTLDREVLMHMYEAGCYRLNLAFESGSQDVLKSIIKKPVLLERDIKTADIAKKMGFEIIGYFVIGLPGETYSQIKETIKLAENPLFDYVTISIATPQEGTRLQELCAAGGLIKNNKGLFDASRRSEAVYSTSEFSAYDLEKIRYQEWDRINFSSGARKNKIAAMMGLSKEGLEGLRKKTALDFKKRWPHDFVISGQGIGLSNLSKEDLMVNARWMKEKGLRLMLERPDDNLTPGKQIKWFRKLQKDSTKLVLKIIVIGRVQSYIGNVTAFCIDKKNKEAELSIFIGDKKYRSKGYGGAALEMFIKYLKSVYGNEMTFRIKCLKTNKAAFALYKKLGFEECNKTDYSFECDDTPRYYMALSPRIQHLPGRFGFRTSESKLFPEMIVCGMSFTCNARCIHCPNAATNFTASIKGGEKFMSWEILKKVADECALYPHTMVRVSSCGEVLTHPEAINMIKYILDVKKDKNVALTTNGSLLTPEKSLALLKKGIRSIEVSVDASTKEIFEKIRVGLSFDTVLYNIKELVRQRNAGGYSTKVVVSVIEQDSNKNFIKEITEFWKNIVDDVLIRKLLSFKGIIPRGEGYQAYMPKNTPCPFLWERLLVDSAGNVRGCVSDIYNSSCLGNVKHNTISELWQGDLINKWRNMHLEGKMYEVPMCKGCVDVEYRSWEYNYFYALNKLNYGRKS